MLGFGKIQCAGCWHSALGTWHLTAKQINYVLLLLFQLFSVGTSHSRSSMVQYSKEKTISDAVSQLRWILIGWIH
jgi:hypothetical protein